MYHTNNISNVPFNFINPSHIFEVNHIYMRKDVLIELRDNILLKMLDTNYITPKRIFVKRKSRRISKNQKEVFELLEKHGFEEIIFENLDFKTQVNYIYNAEFVVGVTGAVWTNLLFANPKMDAICFMQDNLKNFSCFSNLADTVGVNLYYSFYKSLGNPSQRYMSGFEINTDELEYLVCNIVGSNLKLK